MESRVEHRVVVSLTADECDDLDNAIRAVLSVKASVAQQILIEEFLDNLADARINV